MRLLRRAVARFLCRRPTSNAGWFAIVCGPTGGRLRAVPCPEAKQPPENQVADREGHRGARAAFRGPMAGCAQGGSNGSWPVARGLETPKMAVCSRPDRSVPACSLKSETLPLSGQARPLPTMCVTAVTTTVTSLHLISGAIRCRAAGQTFRGQASGHRPPIGQTARPQHVRIALGDHRHLHVGTSV